MPKQTCFLIDDDEDDREIFQLALDEVNADLNYITSRNGIEALQMLSERSFAPDYIFLDINMPLMTGGECLIQIRKFDHLRNVPVYMYTTCSETDDEKIFLANGATQIVTKPAKISELVEMLQDILIK